MFCRGGRLSSRLHGGGVGWRDLKKEREDVNLCSSAYTTDCSAWLHVSQDKQEEREDRVEEVEKEEEKGG